MLIDKGVTVGEVVTIKLTSGEELVAKLVEDGANYLKLGRPMVLTMGQQGLGMVPYLFTVSPDKDVKLNRSTVTVVEASAKEFADAYTQQTTGIKLV
jgi:DhnA family fructose-bisphosphate aldolase class Ia